MELCQSVKHFQTQGPTYFGIDDPSFWGSQFWQTPKKVTVLNPILPETTDCDAV